MSDAGKPKNIWSALDLWAKKLKPWQRRILSLATVAGRINDDQINEAYELFLQDSGLTKKETSSEIPFDITGRPTESVKQAVRLDQIDVVCGVNALPDGASLTFGPSLTVVYGRNGAGKSGFARLFANACFSRHKPRIIGNIYDDAAPADPSATFHFCVDGIPVEPFVFAPRKQHVELKRISVFDSAVARSRISETAAFEFRPSGFDVFPEMARVYAVVGKRLDAAIKERTGTTDFSKSFIGKETVVSKTVAALGAASDIRAIRELASYGGPEKARFKEIDKQLVALKSNSRSDVIANLRQALEDVAELLEQIASLSDAFSAANARRRASLSSKAKETAEAAKLLGSDKFKRPFFKAVGTTEWENFAKAAHALARKESKSYPSDGDRCLLCERPFTKDSLAHVAALLEFVEGDAQRSAESASEEVKEEISELRELDLKIFTKSSRVRDHVHRLDPKVETAVAELVDTLVDLRKQTIKSLNEREPVKGAPSVAAVERALGELVERIKADLKGLESNNPESAIERLELERQTLRHREVLKKLLSDIEAHVVGAQWCAKVERVRSALNPRHVTEKEKELFTELIGVTYRSRLADECATLDCSVPVELQTIGQRGQTVRSLSMKGGYSPELILSEGEQKAIALADFLTETGLNPASAGIVLDDPVTSQDHERKTRIAKRLVEEAKTRQVVVFTHDLPFLNAILTDADNQGIDTKAHWIDRDAEGKPGQVTLDDAPATNKTYDTTGRAKQKLSEAKQLSGTARQAAIEKGMGALRRTIEETVVKRLLKGIVPRWSDRVIVTGLKKIKWDDGLAEEFVAKYEELSAYIDAHSHTDEASGAPPQLKDLDKLIADIDGLIKRARQEKQ